MGYRISKNEVINCFKQIMNSQDLVLVDDTSEDFARHICFGGSEIYLLRKLYYNVYIQGEVFVMEYFQCNVCGKILLNRHF